MKLVHFYHIYADGLWKKPFTEHVEALRNSGLLNQLGGSFKIGVTGADNSLVAVLQYADFLGVEVEVSRHEYEGWEQVTLDALLEYSQSSEDCYILYAHTKGAGAPTIYSDPWRRSMTHGVVTWWPHCIAALDNGCHLAGAYWMKNNWGTWFYGGNFFWVKSSAVKTLSNCDRETRWSAEGWVNSIQFTLGQLVAFDVTSDAFGIFCLPQYENPVSQRICVVG